MKNKLTTLIILLITMQFSFAQNGKLFREKREQIKSIKVAYITNELSLTPEESAKFWPLYNAFEEKQQEIIEEFEFLDDWEQKYEYIIDLGKELKGLPEEKKSEENLIKGCQSKVWLDAEFRDGKLFFNADSDGILPKGIVSLLVRIYSGHSTQEILDSDFDFISKIGLQEFLSPSRANGLMAMTKQIKFYAVAFQLKS